MLGAFQAEQLLAVGILIVSTLLNAAYFVPVLHIAFFEKEAPVEARHGVDDLGGRPHEHDHGEAPLPIVIALTATAGLTVLLFFFPDVALELASALGGATP